MGKWLLNSGKGELLQVCQTDRMFGSDPGSVRSDLHKSAGLLKALRSKKYNHLSTLTTGKPSGAGPHEFMGMEMH